MKHSSFENRLIKQISEKLPGASPGVMVQVYQNGRKVCDIGVGETYAYYDLASLTKIVFSTQAMMRAYVEGKWNMQSKVSETLRWFPHDNVSITQLLNHSSGMKWWMPFYKDLDLALSVPERWRSLSEILAKTPLESSQQKSVYSDLGFLTIAFLLEAFFEKPLIDIWHDLKEQFYPRLSLDFSVGNHPAHPLRFYAPTEKCPWRDRVMQGQVQFATVHSFAQKMTQTEN